jgi:hypothetical protein
VPQVVHLAGGELEQIQFLVGHASVQTTERTWAASRNSIMQSTTTSAWKTPDGQMAPDADFLGLANPGVLSVII